MYFEIWYQLVVYVISKEVISVGRQYFLWDRQSLNLF